MDRVITTKFVVLVLGMSFIMAALTFGIYALSAPADRGSELAAIFGALRWIGATAAAIVAARYGQAAARSSKSAEDSVNGKMDAKIRDGVRAVLVEHGVIPSVDAPTKGVGHTSKDGTR